MKTILIILIVSLLSIAPSSESVRIGVIDTMELFRRSVEMRSLQRELEESLYQKRFELEPLQRKIENLQSEIESRRFVLSSEELSNKERELEVLFREYIEKRDEVAEYLSQREEELMGPLLEKLQSIIERVGREEGYDIIIEKDALVFSAPKLDITSLVIEYLDEKEDAFEENE